MGKTSYPNKGGEGLTLPSSRLINAAYPKSSASSQPRVETLESLPYYPHQL